MHSNILRLFNTWLHYFDGGLCGCVQETVEELESTSTRLRETEHTLSCTKTVLHRAATEREEQKHLVEKHVETELKLAQQAKKLLTIRLVVESSAGCLLHSSEGTGRA